MKDSNTNIKFSYLYRDAGNYKIFCEVIFNNPENLSIERIENEIKSNLIDRVYFVPASLEIPILAFDDYDEELDHSWNELEIVEITNEKATDKRNILDFINQLKQLNYKKGF